MIVVFFVTAIVLLLLGVPVAVTVGSAAIVFILGSGISPLIIIQRLFVGLDSVSFIAIPMFILAGDIMNRAVWPSASSGCAASWWATSTAVWPS